MVVKLATLKLSLDQGVLDSTKSLDLLNCFVSVKFVIFLLFIFVLSGENPRPARGTLMRLFMKESGKAKFKHDKWGVQLQSQNGNDVTMLVRKFHYAANYGKLQ